MNCFEAVRRDRQGGSVNNPPPGILKGQRIFLAATVAEGFLSSLEKSHSSSWNLETEDTWGSSPLEPVKGGATSWLCTARAVRRFTPGLPWPLGSVSVRGPSLSLRQP